MHTLVPTWSLWDRVYVNMAYRCTYIHNQKSNTNSSCFAAWFFKGNTYCLWNFNPFIRVAPLFESLLLRSGPMKNIVLTELGNQKHTMVLARDDSCCFLPKHLHKFRSRTNWSGPSVKSSSPRSPFPTLQAKVSIFPKSRFELLQVGAMLPKIDAVLQSVKRYKEACKSFQS